MNFPMFLGAIANRLAIAADILSFTLTEKTLFWLFLLSHDYFHKFFVQNKKVVLHILRGFWTSGQNANILFNLAYLLHTKVLSTTILYNLHPLKYYIRYTLHYIFFFKSTINHNNLVSQCSFFLSLPNFHLTFLKKTRFGKYTFTIFSRPLNTILDIHCIVYSFLKVQ